MQIWVADVKSVRSGRMWHCAIRSGCLFRACGAAYDAASAYLLTSESKESEGVDFSILQTAQETAMSVRQRAQGVQQEAEFLADARPALAAGPEEDLVAAEARYQAELAQELQVRLFFPVEVKHTGFG